VIEDIPKLAMSLGVALSGECLWGECLVWLIGTVVCLLAAAAGPMSVSAGSGWPHLRCSTIGSCQPTVTSEIVKRAVPVSCKYIITRPLGLGLVFVLLFWFNIVCFLV